MPPGRVRTTPFGNYFRGIPEKGPPSTEGAFFSTGIGHSCTGRGRAFREMGEGPL